MPRLYTPRRASKTRWLQHAPDYILDVFDHPKFGDRYTVIFAGKGFTYALDKGKFEERGEYGNTYLQYLSLNDIPTHPSHGISMWGEMKAYEAMMYRYRNKHRRIKWMDLPENVRDHIIARATAE
jgi:hypothetical protein